MSSTITTTGWVPRGFAAPFPKKYDFNEEEFARIAELAKLKLDDAQDDLDDARAEAGEDSEADGDADGDADADAMDVAEAAASHVSKEKKEKKEKKKKSETETAIDIHDDDLKEYNLDNYDDDDEADDAVADGQPLSIFSNIKSLSYYESNKDDPYITLENAAAEDEEEDREELQVLATDNMLLAAKIEDELAHLEVYVYEDEADNLYVHHDIMLPAIPLCLEWLDVPVGTAAAGTDASAAANFVAVGTVDPDIEIWDLDTVDCMYPNAILGAGAKGAEAEQKRNKKSKGKGKKANDAYHVDAVLALAANRKHRNLLASASADKTVKLWDLSTAACAKSYTYHSDKVCSLAWHAVESTVLLSGSYDRTVVAADMRAADSAAAVSARWGVESDVENVRWDPHDANYFFVTTEAGYVHYHDVRMAPKDPAQTKAVWTLKAHDESVSSFDVNAHIPGFLATGSGDKTVKLWNVAEAGKGPQLVVSRNLDVGRVFSATFAPDAEVAFRMSVAGSKGVLRVWDTSTNAPVRKAFATKVPNPGAEVTERLVGVADDADSDDESDDDEMEE